MNDLTQERLKELLNYCPETGVFTWRNNCSNGLTSGAIAGCSHPRGYRSIRIDQTAHYSHRLAWLYVHGEWPKNQIDHINGVKSDNKIINLRQATGRENVENQTRPKATNKTGYLGVICKKDKYHASICSGGKKIYLGSHESPEIAHEFYLAAKRQLHEGCTI